VGQTPWSLQGATDGVLAGDDTEWNRYYDALMTGIIEYGTMLLGRWAIGPLGYDENAYARNANRSNRGYYLLLRILMCFYILWFA
jgi:hypothetical protein